MCTRLYMHSLSLWLAVGQSPDLQHVSVCEIPESNPVDPSPPGCSSLLFCILFCLFVLLCATNHLDPASIILAPPLYSTSVAPRSQAEERQNHSPASGASSCQLGSQPGPRDPDLAALRLRRVKRCTQRGLLYLYAPYIGRLLSQPTGT